VKPIGGRGCGSWCPLRMLRIALAKRETEGRRYCGAAGGKVGGGYTDAHSG
jgi:hypothetical protein